jgi:hypothetical protein|tara:strand:+ start:16149 stop:16487 length:339 start_codon:yes stop_codon:yes gene_type:complete
MIMKNAIIALSLSVLFSQNDTTFIRDFYQYDLNEYQSLEMELNFGLGALELILPKNVNIKLRIDHSFLSSVDVDGLLSKGNDKYVSKDWDNARPTITGDISVGIGSVDVEVD